MNSNHFSNGLLSVCVPEGWKLFETTDVEGKKTQKKLFIYKNAVTETDIFSKAGITVCFFGKNDYYFSPKSFYDNVKDIKSFSLGGRLFAGYTCTSLGYPYLMLDSQNDGTVLQVMILLENGDEKISFDDADVKMILESITYAE